MTSPSFDACVSRIDLSQVTKRTCYFQPRLDDASHLVSILLSIHKFCDRVDPWMQPHPYIYRAQVPFMTNVPYNMLFEAFLVINNMFSSPLVHKFQTVGVAAHDGAHVLVDRGLCISFAAQQAAATTLTRASFKMRAAIVHMRYNPSAYGMIPTVLSVPSIEPHMVRSAPTRAGHRTACATT
jgi:hypothetical protein